MEDFWTGAAIVCLIIAVGLWLTEPIWTKIAWSPIDLVTGFLEWAWGRKRESPGGQPVRPVEYDRKDSVTINTKQGTSQWARVVTSVPEQPEPAAPPPVEWTPLHKQALAAWKKNPAIDATTLQQILWPGSSKGRKTTEAKTILAQIKSGTGGTGTSSVPVPSSVPGSRSFQE